MSTPQRITQRHDAAYRRRELFGNPEHLRANAESMLHALNRARHISRWWLVLACVPFAVLAWVACL